MGWDTPGLAQGRWAWFEALNKRYLDPGKHVTPTRRIRAYVQTLIARYPDNLPDERIDEMVWSDAPLINDASGPLFYFGADDSCAVDYAIVKAQDQGLVCFDPESNGLCQTSA